jgi:hypothetical protein
VEAQARLRLANLDDYDDEDDDDDDDVGGGGGETSNKISVVTGNSIRPRRIAQFHIQFYGRTARTSIYLVVSLFSAHT